MVASFIEILQIRVHRCRIGIFEQRRDDEMPKPPSFTNAVVKENFAEHVGATVS